MTIILWIIEIMWSFNNWSKLKIYFYWSFDLALTLVFIPRLYLWWSTSMILLLPHGKGFEIRSSFCLSVDKLWLVRSLLKNSAEQPHNLFLYALCSMGNFTLIPAFEAVQTLNIFENKQSLFYPATSDILDYLEF